MARVCMMQRNTTSAYVIVTEHGIYQGSLAFVS